ncbi:cytochrome P450 monooxygenase-like protein [Hypoxylon trugodes]|uniref:cytochrome P450 monooxygenase-like protein n=1 Tax=Hypoxylon trugodes TaxID=326681 RepID=UPI0021A077F0|nr:cytochrome P450 monooxygenase-like protein [Hypoxylon trugodes]KAI1384078.1 cytochrome P450 monooxygenase-like protein [Hypoxylon trugodes]
MFDLPMNSPAYSEGPFILVLLGIVLVLASYLYNLYLHPLADIPGPFWGRISGIPSWYYTCRGDRHIWLWRQFQIHGDKIRPEPNTVLFRDPKAYSDIYSMKSNVRRSRFYEGFKKNEHEVTTLSTIDVAKHAKRRRRLNLCFTEKSVRAASNFVIKHVDRWIELLKEEHGLSTEWSATIDFTDKIDALVFDIMGDLSFGRSFNSKEPGENPLKEIPHNIAEYMRFYYMMCRLPVLEVFLWLKPRGVNQLLNLIAPPAARRYNRFVSESVTNRIALQRQQAGMPEADRRQDMFYFLAEARDPDTGALAYRDGELRAESSLLIIAGSDTTAISLSGIFFYLTGNPQCCLKLVQEIRTTFESVNDIIHGPKLMGCTYLRACVDEGMRLTPSGPSEMPREILSGGLNINGRHYPEGTIVGTVPWVNSRNPAVYGDPEVFRPERWILDEAAGVNKETLARAKAGFHPFISGPGNCVGQNLAMSTILIIVARTLYELDVRRTPGSTLGGGKAELGWGQSDPNQLQLIDAYVSLRRGPELQFKLR